MGCCYRAKAFLEHNLCHHLNEILNIEGTAFFYLMVVIPRKAHWIQETTELLGHHFEPWSQPETSCKPIWEPAPSTKYYISKRPY